MSPRTTSHFYLWRTLVAQELRSRYRGSLLGRAWPVLLPLLMLAIYGFVFGVVFRARWPGLAEDDHLGFTLNLFTGLLVHGLLAESVGQAPGLMQRYGNFVRKVVFPLQILPAVPLGVALVNLALGLAILGPHYSTMEVARADFRLAREFGLVASMHQGGGEAKTPGGWERLEAEGLVGAGINIVHGNNLSDEQIRRFVGAGVSFTVTPENEMTQGHGFPITGRVLSAGGQPSFGVDIESLVSSDMFTVARMALACQRALDNDLSRRQTGAIPETCSVSTRDALRWITLEGARMLGLADRIGSLTPGKQADIVMLRADDWNMWPVHDPCSTVIMQASTGNVEAVMIAGRFRKRDGRLDWPDAERVKRELAQSGRRIVAELGIPTQLRTAAA